MRTRRLGTGGVVAVCVLAGIVLVVATVLAYGRRELFDTRSFTARAVEVVHTDAVSTQIALTLTRQVVESGSPDLVAVRPLVESSIERLIRSGAADPALRLAVSEAHSNLFYGASGGPVALNLRDVLVLTRGIVRAARPDAPQIPVGDVIAEVGVTTGEPTAWVRRTERLRRLALVFTTFAALLFGLAVGVARDRRRAVVSVGATAAAAGFVVAVATSLGRAFVSSRYDADTNDVATAIWSGMVGDLGRWGLALVGVGCIIAAAAASVIPRPDVSAGLRRVWALVTVRTEGRLGRLFVAVRAIIAIWLGVVALFDWQTAARIVTMALGAVALFWGIAELLGLVEAGGTGRSAERVRRTRVAVASAVGGAAGVVAIGFGAVAFATGGDGAPSRPGPVACNGSTTLCDRPLDEVAMVASHNSMSVALDPGWFNAHHYNPIVDQLDAGVRSLLIDTHLGQQTDQPGFGGTRRVQTDLSDATREQLAAEIGDDALAAAERLTGRLAYGEDVDRPRLFLCHGLCEIGATDALSEYRRIADWLLDHPDQVVVVVIQDDSPMTDNVAALRASGLAELAWDGPLDGSVPMPTLRQMIDADRPLVVMHESPGDSGEPWFHEAYAVTQETPFAFPSVATIESPESCRPNRGPAGAPFFLLNHWLDKQPVLVSQAEQVNQPEVLLGRARLCERERRAFPNLIAVNFVEVGDPYAVVDDLNGLTPAP